MGWLGAYRDEQAREEHVRDEYLAMLEDWEREGLHAGHRASHPRPAADRTARTVERKAGPGEPEKPNGAPEGAAGGGHAR